MEHYRCILAASPFPVLSCLLSLASLSISSRFLLLCLFPFRLHFCPFYFLSFFLSSLSFFTLLFFLFCSIFFLLPIMLHTLIFFCFWSFPSLSSISCCYSALPFLHFVFPAIQISIPSLLFFYPLFHPISCQFSSLKGLLGMTQI